MGAGVLIALWVVVMAIVFIAWCRGADEADPAAAAAAAADPYARELDAFRRELHDWDRDGGGG